MIEAFMLILVGGLAAFVGAIVGLGGGFIIVPSMILLSNLSPKEIVGTSMAVLVVSSLTSTIVFMKQKRIDYKSGIYFSVAMFPGSIIGAWATKYMTSHLFYVLFGCFMMIMATLVFFKPTQPKNVNLKSTIQRNWIDENGEKHDYAFSLKAGLIASFFVGFLSSLFGIGGGSVMVMFMVLFLFFPPHIATATSMLSIFCSSIIGAGTHLYFGHVIWSYALWLAIGAFVGGRAGALWSKKIAGPYIMRALSICMLLIGFFMVFK